MKEKKKKKKKYAKTITLPSMVCGWNSYIL